MRKSYKDRREFLKAFNPGKIEILDVQLGDVDGCTVACAKCRFKRLLEGARPGRWCRHCKYEHWDEYFGDGGINDQLCAELRDGKP